MKNGIDNFIKLLVEGDFFLIFLIVIMIVIVSVIIYLIKLQVNEKLYNELDEEEDNIEKYIDDEVKTEDDIKTVDIEKPIVSQTKFDFEKEEIVDTKKPSLDEIKSYETDQEEMAIISADELESRLKSMKENGQYDKHYEKIDEYEADQENKAIISYDELLNKGSNYELNYEKEETHDDLTVKKVDLDNLVNKNSSITPNLEVRVISFQKEEAFLEALKRLQKELG